MRSDEYESSHWRTLRTVHRATSSFRNALPHQDASNCPGRPARELRTPPWLTPCPSHSALFASSQLTPSERKAISSPALEALRDEIFHFDAWRDPKLSSRPASAASLSNLMAPSDHGSFEAGWALPRPSSHSQLIWQRASGDHGCPDSDGHDETVAGASSHLHFLSSRPSTAFPQSLRRSASAASPRRKPQQLTQSPSRRGRKVFASPTITEMRELDAHRTETWRVRMLQGPPNAVNYERRGTIAFPGGYPAQAVRRGVHLCNA